MNLKQEADRIEDLARRDRKAARETIDAILDRTKRLTGDERDAAMQFNARLMTELRRRNVLIYDYREPDFSYEWPE